MDNATYHQHPSVSHSGLAVIANKTPAHYQAYINGYREETPAMREGTNIHCAVLEPERFAREYVVMPKFDMRRTIDKELSAQFHAANAGKTCITQDEMDRLLQIQQAVREHPLAAELLCDGMAEQSVFTTDPETGVAVRCRPDYTSGANIIDVKSTIDASSDHFMRAAYAYRYHQQAAFYLDVMGWAGARRENFYFIAVEKTPPFAVQVFRASDAFVSRGRRDYRQALNTYSECLRSGVWPAYSIEPASLDLPPWVTRNDDEIVEIGYVE
jgi:hypothetical protein